MTDLHRRTGDQLTATELYAVLTLRTSIFVVEQKAAYPELDGRDLRADTIHLWYQPGDAPLSYLRILTEGGESRIGRVCTAQEARGTGLGTRLMAEAMAELGDRPVVLDSQVHAQNLYVRFGFHPVGEPYDDEDGIPHVAMRRDLSPRVEHSG